MNFFDNNSGSSSPAPLNLTKGDILDLTKEAPSLKNVILAAGWDTNDAGKDNFDLDISAFLLNANGRVTNPSTQIVFFNAMQQKGIFLEGDNQTGAGDGDDEKIHIALDELDADVCEIIFNVNIYDAVAKRQTFGMVKNSYVRLLDQDNNDREILRFDLKDDASTATAVEFAKLKRNNNGWTFEALGNCLNVADLNALLIRYM